MLQPVEQEIWQLLEPGVDELGLRVVRVRFAGGEHSGTLQVMIEPKETKVAITLKFQAQGWKGR